MRKYFFLLLLAVFTVCFANAQDTAFHYVKLVHVGEHIMPVRTLNISVGNGTIQQDSVEALNDTLQSVFVSTDIKSYKILSNYLDNARFRIKPAGGRIEFGTFKIIADGKRYYVPDISITPYLKKMIAYLKKKNADAQLVQSIIDNYPWVFNP